MNRLKALIDPSAWLLFVLGAAVMAIVDFPMFKTLIQWTTYAAVMAGLTILFSRLMFPQLDVMELAAKNQQVIVASIVIFDGLLFLGLILWVNQ